MSCVVFALSKNTRAFSGLNAPFPPLDAPSPFPLASSPFFLPNSAKPNTPRGVHAPHAEHQPARAPHRDNGQNPPPDQNRVLQFSANTRPAGSTISR